VTICCLDLKDSILNGKERNIKGTTTKIENENISLSLVLLVESIGNSSSSWLVDNTGNIESSNGSGIFGGLPLRVVEIGWDSDNSGAHALSKVSLSNFLHLDKNHG